MFWEDGCGWEGGFFVVRRGRWSLGVCFFMVGGSEWVFGISEECFFVGEKLYSCRSLWGRGWEELGSWSFGFLEI